MTSYNYSYNVLINRLEAFAAGHFLIRRFTHGQIDMSDQLQDDQYPFMHVTPDTIEPVPGAMNFGFHIMFADIPRDKEYKAEYQREVISDCIRLGQDLIAEVKNGLELFGFDVQLLETPTFEPFMEEQKNTVTGVAFTLKLSVPWDWSACDIPAIWAVGGVSGTGGNGQGYGITLETNGVENVVQTLLNLVEGTNITITDNGNGSVTIDSAGGGVSDYVSTAFNVNHTTSTGNPYAVGDRVWYLGNVYQCIANNDAILPTNTSYWTLVGAGYRLRQTPVDWNASTGDFQILNKPTIPAAQVNSDWNSVSGVSEILNKPTIPAAQVNSDWNAVSGLAQILNKPFIPVNIDDLADVSAAAPANFNSLYYLGGVWKSGFIALDWLQDVTVPTPTNGQVLTFDTATGVWIAATPSGGGGGTVTSVGLTAPAAFTVVGSPITTSGTLAITGAGIAAQYIDGTGALQTFPTLPPVIGDMLKSVYDTDADGVVDSAERIEIVVRNSTGVTLTKAQVVYLSGATGNRPNAVLADASTEATSSKTIGLVTANISNNSDGFVAVNGTLHNLDTSAFAAGDTLWLSETAGAMQANTPPAEPAHAVFIGYVARAHPTLGRIVLAIQNGYELNELHGVSVPTPIANDYFYYNGTTSLWQNRQLTASVISDATTVGQNLVTLPNPSAVRFLRINSDNTVTARTAAEMVSDLGIGGGSTSVLYQFANGDTVVAGATRFGSLFGGSSNHAAVDTVRRTPMITNGTLSRFYVMTNTAQPATGSLVINVRKNSVDQALTITIAAGSAAGVFSDLVNSVSVAVGDQMGIKLVNNASTVSAAVLNNQVLLTI